MSNFKTFLEHLKSGLKSPESLIEGSFTMDNIQAVAQALAQISSQEIEPLLDRIFIDTATGSDLSRRAMEYAMCRKSSSNATGMVKISGTAGVTIPKGLLVASDTLTFSISAPGVINSAGFIELAAVCTVAGDSGNIAANSIHFIINSTANLVNITNLLPFEGGANEETDEDFRARILEKIHMPLTGGNANDYVYWAKQVPGIGRAKCFPLWNGNGTVKVSVLSDSFSSVNRTVLQEVINNIEKNRPVGAAVTVTSAVALSVSVSITVYLKEGETVLTAKTAILDTIKNFFDSIAFDGKTTTLSYLKLSELIFKSNTVTDILSYTLNGKNVSMPIGNEEYCRLSEVIVNVP